MLAVVRGGGEGHEAADGEKEERAQAKADVGGGDGARDFADENGEAQAEPSATPRVAPPFSTTEKPTERTSSSRNEMWTRRSTFMNLPMAMDERSMRSIVGPARTARVVEE